MDGMASTEEKAPPLADASSEASVSASVEVEQRPQSAPLPAAAKVESGGEEDEQVERFFALLANIRALRTMYGASSEYRGRKRARDAEPPWKPAFKMEDFEERQQDYAAGKKKKKKTVEGQGTPVPGAVADDEKVDDGEVVETQQGSSGHRVRERAG